MERQTYVLVRSNKGWAFSGPHELSPTYPSKDDAFEAAVVAMRSMLTQGDEIALTIPGGDGPWGRSKHVPH